MSDRDSGEVILSFLLGGLIGAALGILYAPRAGKEIRRKLKDLSEELSDRIDNLGDNVKNKAENIVDDVKNRAEHMVEEGRGKITKYLDPYKSKYRMELIAPETDDQAILKEYYLTVEKTFREILPAYLNSLQNAKSVSSYSQSHETKMREFVKEIYVNDFAVKMGKKIFKDQFKKYWADGFWSVEVQMMN